MFVGTSLMASQFIASFFSLVTVLNAWPNPQTFVFDPNSPPGPLQECSQGIPRMTGPIPFPPNTPLNDDEIGHWVERHIECLYGNYFNNDAEHIDWDTLSSTVVAPDWAFCWRKSDGSEKCFSHEQNGKRSNMIRDVVDITDMVVEVVEVNERSFTIVGNGSLTLQIQVGAFQVGHAFEDSILETFIFNDDGRMSKQIMWTEDDFSYDMMEWAEQTLRGMGDYLKVDHANRDNYYQIDLGDNGVRVFIAFIIFWVIIAPIGMVWIAMRFCNGQKVNKYEKVNVAEAEA